jgi:hypothetical protein
VKVDTLRNTMIDKSLSADDIISSLHSVERLCTYFLMICTKSMRISSQYEVLLFNLQ